ncbi:MAG: hypothetical protein F6J93_14970 [Oscillatoria sp. SIO1A7]|nr:hypothetical protein [Oscillatoria sp. SIO1A7]
MLMRICERQKTEKYLLGLCQKIIVFVRSPVFERFYRQSIYALRNEDSTI